MRLDLESGNKILKEGQNTETPVNYDSKVLESEEAIEKAAD